MAGGHTFVLPYFPFDADEYDMPMNARALAPDILIEVDPALYRAELALKDEILAQDHRYYCQARAGTDAMQWEAIELLLPNMVRHHPDHFALQCEGDRWTWTNRLLDARLTFRLGDAASLPLTPLDWLGRQVQEDLILMDGAPGAPLVAGHLCFGGSWCLDDKMGKSFLAIHHEVPLFAERIGRPADLMMQRLKPGHPTARINWSITTTDRLDCAPRTYHEWVHTRRGITARNAGERCYLRLERQTLSRLPRTSGILFTIHTYRAPIGTLLDDPERTRRFTNVVKGIPRPVRDYKGMTPFADALVEYLEARCRAYAGLPRGTASKAHHTNGATIGGTPVPLRHSTTTPESWEPLPLIPSDVLEGEPCARVHWIARSSVDEPLYQTSLVELQPSSLRWLTTANETVHILTGAVVVETDGGERHELGPGDIVCLPVNSLATWTIVAPLRALLVAAS